MINAARIRRDVIVIGGSAGAFQAARHLLGLLPGNLGVHVGLALHRSPHYESRRPALLARSTALTIVEADDGE